MWNFASLTGSMSVEIVYGTISNAGTDEKYAGLKVWWSQYDVSMATQFHNRVVQKLLATSSKEEKKVASGHLFYVSAESLPFAFHCWARQHIWVDGSLPLKLIRFCGMSVGHSSIIWRNCWVGQWSWVVHFLNLSEQLSKPQLLDHVG